MSIIPTPPVGYWGYWINGCQLFVPNGHTVISYCSAPGGGYQVQLTDGAGMTYQHWFPMGATHSMVHYNPPLYPAPRPQPAPGQAAEHLPDDELVFQLLERGYAVWKPPVGQ